MGIYGFIGRKRHFSNNGFRNLIMAAAMASAGLAGAAGDAKANIVTLPGVIYYGDYDASYYTGVTTGYVELSGPINGPTGFFGGSDQSAAFASWSSALGPTPSLSASASDLAPSSALLIAAAAHVRFSLTYFFEVVGPGGPSATVPVLVSANATVTGAGNAQFSAAPIGTGNGYSLPPGLAVLSPATPGGWSIVNAPLTAFVGTEYEVMLYAQALPPEGNGSPAVSIDPLFTIDPSFADASQYQLIFSPGVSDIAPGAASGVPEPPVWMMMLTAIFA